MASDNTAGVQTAALKTPPKPSFWNNPTYRAIFFQVLVIAIVVAAGVFIINNTLTNLAKQGIASGFGFLDTTAGFAIIMHLIEYSEESTYGRVFFVGLLNTIIVSVIGIMFATILGFIVGVARLSNNWVVSKMAAVYIEIVRNIPLLLQIFFWYFAVLRQLPAPKQSIELFDSIFFNKRGLYTPNPIPDDGFGFVWIALFAGLIATYFVRRWAVKRQEATGEQFPVFLTALGLIIGLPVVVFFIMGMPVNVVYPELKGFNFSGGMVLIPEFICLVLALSIYTASFIAEIVRAGIMAVNKGQSEASHALGLRNGPTLRLVVIPQALRVIIPPLTSQYLNLTKNSSLAVAIAYPDMVSVFGGTTLMQTGQAVEILAMTMGVYLTLSLLISMFMNWYNEKMALVER